MSDFFPPDLLADILTRLPVEPLLRFRCACKAWCRIIDDSTFIKSHLQRQNNNGRHLLLRNERGTKLYTISLDSLDHYETNTNPIEAPPLETLIRRGVPRLLELPAPHCNGLFLIYRFDRSDWTLWNPFTREYRQLPPYPSAKQGKVGGSRCIGLGYDSVSDDYKVVKIGDRYDPAGKVTTSVYSLKSNSWKVATGCPCRVPWVEVAGVFVNGALHWLTEMSRGDGSPVILAFDVKTEDYRLIPLPSTLSGLYPLLKLSVLNGYLFVSCVSSIYRLDGYGGENKWTMLYSFRISESGVMRPVALLKSKREILVQYYQSVPTNDDFILINIETKARKKVWISGASDIRTSQMCVASLVRLNKRGGVDGSDGSKAPDNKRGGVDGSGGSKAPATKKRKLKESEKVLLMID